MSTNLKKKLLVKGLRVALFSLVLPAIFIIKPVMPGYSLEPSAPAAGFQVALVDKMADFPVQWVAAGGGVLAYGVGQDVDFALAKEPFSPISHLSFEGVISGGLIIGKYAYLSQEGLGLRMIDLEVLFDPVDLGFYPLSGSTFRLANWGNLMFVGGTSDGVQIFELSSDQQNMMGQPQATLVDRGIIPVEESITAIAADQEKLYVATAGKEIRIYDISDPSLILEVEALPVTLPVRSMAINGGHLYVAAGTDGLQILDLSAPGKAETVATYPVPSESLYPAGRLVYVATGNRGLHLLNAGPIGTTTFTVQVAPGGFSPSTVNTNTGDTVQWVWMGSGHTTTSGTSCAFNGPGLNTWDSGILNAGATFQFTFNTPGSFPYFCNAFIQDEPHCAFFGEVGTVNVSGVAPVINISIAPASVNSGSVNVGQFSDQTFTITNQPTSNATLTGNVGTPAAPFSVQTGGGAFSLPPGQSTIVTIRFSPTVAGGASGNLDITHNATNQSSPITVPLSGTGVVVFLPDLIVSSITGPTTAKVGGKVPVSNTVMNQGTEMAKGSSLVNFYLSTDTEITAGDLLIGKRSIRNFGAGASNGPVATQVKMPRTLSPGSYFIGAIIDPANKVTESDEGNNTNLDPNGITVCLSLLKPKLLAPKNRAANIPVTPILDWSDVNGASSYEAQIATDSAFSNIVASMSDLVPSEWTVDPALSSGITHFWRVRAVNPCGLGPWSSTRSFTPL